METRRTLVAWAFGALAVVEISYGFAARPQIFTALALAAELWILRQIHRGQRALGAARCRRFCLWINTHGGVLAGIDFAACRHHRHGSARFLQPGCAGISSSAHRSARAGQHYHVAGIFQRASAAALLINPYGFELVRWLVESVLWLRPQIGGMESRAVQRRPRGLFSLRRDCRRRLSALAPPHRAVGTGRDRRCSASWRSVPRATRRCFASPRSHSSRRISPDALERFQNSFARLTEFFRNTTVQKISTALLAAASLGSICCHRHAAQGARVDNGSSAQGISRGRAEIHQATWVARQPARVF